MDYKGRSCPVCSEIFREEDDIVVCPKCGAPYHRECYKLNNKCIFTELHKSGKSWQEAESEKEAEEAGVKTRRCPHCDAVIPETAIVCTSCGGFIPESVGNGSDEKNSDGQSAEGTVRDADPLNGAGNNGASPFPQGVPLSMFIDPMGGVPKDEDFDGVTGAELSKYVRNNTSYYLPTFYRWKTQKKGRFSFCAFLFTGAWYLYRKQYVKGALISLLYLAVEIGSILLTNAYSSALINEANTHFGNAYNIGFFDYVSWAFNNKPFSEAVMMFAPYFLLLLYLAVRIICGFTANKGYYRHCVNKIKQIKAVPLEPGAENHNKAISAAGGVNTAVTWMCIACYLILYFASFFL